MGSDADERVPPGQREGGAGPSGFEAPDDVVAFARDYFASDFPNPGRVGCPPAQKLRALVSAGRPPHDELSAHLLGCSKCFSEFRAAMEAREMSRQTEAWWAWPARAFAPRPAAALCLLVVALAGFYFWQSRRGSGPGEVAKVVPPEHVVPPAATPAPTQSAQPTPQSSPPLLVAQPSPTGGDQPVAPRRRGPEEIVALNRVRVDLEEYAVVRDTSQPGADRKVISLRRAPTLLELMLPEGGLAGTYRVSVVDAFDKALVTALARSPDGKSLKVAIDARKLKSGEYRLRLVREGASPEYFPLVVEGAGKKSSRAREP